jgi:hypothetical protein
MESAPTKSPSVSALRPKSASLCQRSSLSQGAAQLRRSSLRPEDTNIRYRTIQYRHRFMLHHPIATMTMRRKALRFSNLLLWRGVSGCATRKAGLEQSDDPPEPTISTAPISRLDWWVAAQTHTTSLAYPPVCVGCSVAGTMGRSPIAPTKPQPRERKLFPSFGKMAAERYTGAFP